MDAKGYVNGTNALTMSLLTAMNGFGNLNEEVEDGEPVRQVSRSSHNSFSRSISGASALLEAQMMVASTEIRQNKDDIIAKAHAEHEELQAKMALLIKHPQLWLQFKNRLHAVNTGNGVVGIQVAMKDFISDHPEIEDLYMKEKLDIELPESHGFAKLRRMTMLQSVRALTSELSRETSIDSANRFSPRSITHSSRSISAESQGSRGLAAPRRIQWRSSSGTGVGLPYGCAYKMPVNNNVAEGLGSGALLPLCEVSGDTKIDISKNGLRKNKASNCPGLVGATTA
jgi:hypothetical protein